MTELNQITISATYAIPPISKISALFEAAKAHLHQRAQEVILTLGDEEISVSEIASQLQFREVEQSGETFGEVHVGGAVIARLSPPDVNEDKDGNTVTFTLNILTALSCNHADVQIEQPTIH